MNEDYATLWVCVDCREAYDTGEVIRTNDNHETWSAIHPDDEKYPVTPGLRAEEHEEDCPNFDSEGNFLGIDDEPCEDQEFSWSRCNGCGSTLGGSRHAYTMHFDHDKG